MPLRLGHDDSGRGRTRARRPGPTATSWPRAAQGRRPADGDAVLEDHGRRLTAPSTCRSRWPGRGAAQRGAATASAAPAPWCEQAGGELGDDRRLGVAARRTRARRRASPSRSRSAGASVCGGRRPGASSAGWPGSREKPRPRLCRLMPVVGSTSHEPKPGGVRLDQADGPPAVVGRAQVRRVAGVDAGAGRGGDRVRVDRRRRAGRSRASSGTRRPRRGAPPGDRTRRPWPPRQTGAPTPRRRDRPGSPTRSTSAAMPSDEVALRVGRRWCELVRRTPRREHVTQSACDRSRSAAREPPAAELEQALAERAAVEGVAAAGRRSPAT